MRFDPMSHHHFVSLFVVATAHPDTGVDVELPSVPSSPALTRPEKMVMLEAATAVTTLRLMKHRRVNVLEVGGAGSCFI